MLGLRQKHWRRFGAALAGLALYAQLAFAGWAALSVATSDAAFGRHALCLADATTRLAEPADHAPIAPAHTHNGFCCLWHQAPGVQPVAIFTPLPIAYAHIVRIEPGDAPFIDGPRCDPANARAPPALA